MCASWCSRRSRPAIAFNPGPEWAVDGEAAKSRLRLCFGLTTKEEIREGVAAFARVCYEETGIPEQSGNVRHTRGRLRVSLTRASRIHGERPGSSRATTPSCRTWVPAFAGTAD